MLLGFSDSYTGIETCQVVGAVWLVFAHEHSQRAKCGKHIAVGSRSRIVPFNHIHTATPTAYIGLPLESDTIYFFFQFPDTGIGGSFPDSIYRGVKGFVKIELKSDNP